MPLNKLPNLPTRSMLSAHPKSKISRGTRPTGTKRSQINKDVWRKLHDKKTRRLVFRFWSERKTRRLVFKFWSEVSGILLWRFRSTNLSIYLQGLGMSTLRGSNRGIALEGGAVERPPQGLPMFLNGLVVSLWNYSDKRNPFPHHALHFLEVYVQRYIISRDRS